MTDDDDDDNHNDEYLVKSFRKDKNDQVVCQPLPTVGNQRLTLILLTWTIWRAPTNASKWRMGFNSAFKALRIISTRTSIKNISNIWALLGFYAAPNGNFFTDVSGQLIGSIFKEGADNTSPKRRYGITARGCVKKSQISCFD